MVSSSFQFGPFRKKKKVIKRYEVWISFEKCYSVTLLLPPPKKISFLAPPLSVARTFKRCVVLLYFQTGSPFRPPVEHVMANFPGVFWGDRLHACPSGESWRGAEELICRKGLFSFSFQGVCGPNLESYNIVY